jgi:cytochrome P450
VRITPDELHVQDPDFFEELYVKSGKLDKYIPFSARFGTDQSLFTTASHDHHRLRRGAINPFFSKKKISDFQPVIQGHLDKLCRKIAQYANTERVLPLHRAFTAVSKPSGIRQTYPYVSLRAF